MPIDSQVLRLLTELTRLTAQGDLSWAAATPPQALVAGTNDLVPSYFETRWKGQAIGLAQRRTKLYDGEHDSFYWTEYVTVIFLDQQRRVIWESNEEPAAMYNLFDVVRSKTADVDGIFQRLLSG